MSYIVALDQGTTSSRAIVFDKQGQVISEAQKEFRQMFPQPGWVEQDANEIWSTQAGVMAEAISRADLAATDVAAIGIANQRETTIVWNRKTGRPICNAIVWQDRRTAAMCDNLKADGVDEVIRYKTGLLLDSYFSGTKIAWILDHIDGARQQAERGELAFGTVDTWLLWNLTGRSMHITDSSNASRTLLLNIHTGQWDDELLSLLNIPESMLPDVRPSSQIYGEVKSDLAAKGAPIAGIIGDQQAATMGQICVEPGLAKCTYGTGCFLLMNTGSEARQSQNNLLSTIAWQRENALTYALEGSVFVGGAIIQWLRDGLKIIRNSADIEPLARQVDNNGGVYLVPALTGLGAPHWDPNARGAILGLTRGSTDAHIARAALEGIAYQVADLVTAMQADAGSDLIELRVDGGGAVNDLLMQIQADLLRIPVVRPNTLETTALGAAYMAGLAVGYWNSVDEIRNNWQIDKTFEPVMAEGDARLLREKWSEAVGRVKS